MRNEAKEAYEALSKLLLEFEANLQSGESVGISGVGPNASEFVVQTVIRRGNLIAVVGDNDDGEFEQLIFAPEQVSVRIFTVKRSKAERKIGFSE